ncbi:MAG: patatin-like phospholipase family protein [Acidobacteria bacterium]|nr:patatin-like phospholipase family protein [Acidobacteriota bacterium]
MRPLARRSGRRDSSGRPPDCPTVAEANRPHLALVLSGGGARAAYQVGFLRFLARQFPGFSPDILTGVSAGAINAAFLASHAGTFCQRVEALADLWAHLRTEDIFRVDLPCLARNVARWGVRLLAGGSRHAPRVRSFVDTQPLRALLADALGAENGVLTGIDRNVSDGSLKAIALTASSYATGRSVTWVQGCEIEVWERPDRTSIRGPLTVEHVMASAAFPLLFPAVQVDGAWYGDGGIGLRAPLSPAVHLGAEQIVVVSTRPARARDDPAPAALTGYPPPAQVAGVLLDAIFLDLLDADAQDLDRTNLLVDALPVRSRGSLRHIDLRVLRPSQDLERLAREHEPQLPRAFRFLTRGLGTREVHASSVLSLLMFQPDYLKRLLDLGEADARAGASELAALLRVA